MRPVSEDCDHVRMILGTYPDHFVLLFFDDMERHIRIADESFPSEVPCIRRMKEVNAELHA